MLICSLIIKYLSIEFMALKDECEQIFVCEIVRFVESNMCPPR
jgi:hypothetical protein